MSLQPHTLVTGATGFLGRAICRELDRQGYPLHAFVRPGSDRSVLDGMRVVFHVGDLTDSPSLLRAAEIVRAACRGATPAWLVHNGATLGYRKSDRDSHRAVNVEGTRAVLAAAGSAGLSRVLHVSSVVAVGHAPGAEGLDEDATWNAGPVPVEYVQTKRRAELLALEACDHLDVRVVNPGAIFGPGGASANTSKLLIALAQGGIGPLAPPGGMSVVGVEDAARGVRLALERGRRGRRYILADEYLSSQDLCSLAVRHLQARGIEARAPRMKAPHALWPVAVACVRALEFLHEPALTTSRAMRMVGSAWSVRSGRAREELGWKTRPFVEVLERTLDDLEVRGLLTRSA